MLLDVLILSVLIALLRGGRPSPSIGLKSPWIILAAMGLQLLAVFVPRGLSPILILLSYVVLLVGLAFNLEHQSLRLIFVGVLLNVIVIGMNLGRMPVSIPAAQRLGFDTAPLVSGTDYKRVAMSESTRFNFLGDVIYVPVPMPRVISVGDVSVALGAFLLIQEYMSKPIRVQVRRLSL